LPERLPNRRQGRQGNQGKGKMTEKNENFTSWQGVLDESEYRPKYPDSPFIHVADLVNKETGKTYREENAELVHNIPVGALVEDAETGVRLFVVHHGRDCDMIPLYSLAVDPEDTGQKKPGFGNWTWHTGYSEEYLKVIRLPAAEGEGNEN
jgi:hypothetical protein